MFTDSVELRSIDVLTPGGRRLARLRGERLAAATTAMVSSTGTTTLPPSGTVSTVIDAVLPRGHALPRRVTHVIR